MIKKILRHASIVLLVASAWGVASCSKSLVGSVTDGSTRPQVVITAHRGGAGYGLENSLSCISRSLEAGVQSIEIDVQLSKDGHVVVCHDGDVDRTTNGEGRISQMTLEELSLLRLKDEEGNVYNESLPLLGQVLELMDGKSHLLLEIKRESDTPDSLEAAVVEELVRYDALSWTTVQSFSDTTLQRIHSLLPEIRLEKLAYCRVLGLPLLFDGSFRRFSLERYSYIESFNFFYRGVSRGFVDELHAAGKRVRLWTINKPSKCPNLPVDGIITDYPDLMITHFR